jgi:aminopeptidase-like protein
MPEHGADPEPPRLTEVNTPQSEPSIAAGQRMHGWLRDLFPICRSITGPGLRETLAYLQRLLPEMKIHAVPSGTAAFDWVVPDEWTIREAWIEHEDGTRVVDFANHNLHVVGYSEPVDRWLDHAELQSHLYSLPDQPDAIPYVTSYYRRHWGFCLTHRTREALRPGRYRAFINSTLASGELNYGELVLPGRERSEILLSTYVCHPSMANNELSGPVVAAALGQLLGSLANRRFTYRVVFVPETIGAIVFLSRNLEALKANTVAGFVLTCIGDERAYSFMPSRLGTTLADRVALHALEHFTSGFNKYTFLDRGSDERQYCSPGVDLPVCSVMRSMYATYPEYHTSLDNPDFVTPEGLAGGYSILRRCLEILEENRCYRATVLCEPHLGKRNLYPPLSRYGSYDDDTRLLKDVVAYCDGNHDLISVADRIRRPATEVAGACRRLLAAGLLTT